MHNVQNILNEISSSLKEVTDRGTVASYIPELSKISANNFGMCLMDIDKNQYQTGDADALFSIQSISKVLTLSQAFSLVGDQLWERVDVEPSGDPFNHLSLLEMENGIPRNPLINAGAIVVCDVLVSHFKNAKEEFLSYVQKIADDTTIGYNAKVALSEKKTGFRNYAAAHLLKSYGNLKNEVEEVLDFYFHQCSLELSCKQLASLFYMFINRGNCPKNENFLSIGQVKRINALMLSCGFYDEAGEFAFKVGLPGKSGVGGGIVAVLPNKFCVATWSPGLNKKGNSKLGMLALEQLTTRTDLSIF